MKHIVHVLNRGWATTACQGACHTTYQHGHRMLALAASAVSPFFSSQVCPSISTDKVVQSTHVALAT